MSPFGARRLNYAQRRTVCSLVSQSPLRLAFYAALLRGFLPLLFIGSAKFCGVLGPLAPPLVGLVPSHCERDLFNGICLKVPARRLRA